MGDALAFRFGERELQEGATRELRRELPKGLHAPSGGGKVATHKKRVCVLQRAIVGDDGLEKRVAVLDGGEARHAAIEIARRAFGQEAFSEGDEGAGACRTEGPRWRCD